MFLYIAYLIMCIVVVPAANSIDVASSSVSIGTNVYTVTSTDLENDQLYYNMTCIPATCPFKIYDCEHCYIQISIKIPIL